MGKCKNQEIQYVGIVRFKTTCRTYTGKIHHRLIFEVKTIEKCYSAYNARSIKVEFNVPFTEQTIQINNYKAHMCTSKFKYYAHSRANRWSDCGNLMCEACCLRHIFPLSEGATIITDYLGDRDRVCVWESPLFPLF